VTFAKTILAIGDMNGLTGLSCLDWLCKQTQWNGCDCRAEKSAAADVFHVTSSCVTCQAVAIVFIT